jgi:alpha-amylase
VANGDYEELGDFVTGPFEARLRRNPNRMQMQLTRDGHVGGRPVRITKGLTLEAGRQTLVVGHLGTQLDLTNVDSISLADEWLGIDVELRSDRPTHLWTFPIETVSQSEAGFELVHQSVVVHPHWLIEASRDGRWSVTMTLAIDTSAAERRPTVAEVIATA